MKQTAIRIQKKLDKLMLDGLVKVMLTGGRSAERLYNEWKKLPNFGKICNTSFYFGDERCVHPTHSESNYGMVMRTLFSNGVPNDCKIYRIHAESNNLKSAANQYAKLIPDSLDILLLGIGEDGHIASLFPNDYALKERKQLCVPVTCTKFPYKRITITPPVIKTAKSTYVLANGKSEIVKMVKKRDLNIEVFPIQLVKKPIWCYE